jgi:hypothetical protein
MNQWSDQPKSAEGEQLLYLVLGGGCCVQIQAVNTAAGTRYSVTAGNLFRSETEFVKTLNEALVIVQRTSDKNMGLIR